MNHLFRWQQQCNLKQEPLIVTPYRVGVSEFKKRQGSNESQELFDPKNELRVMTVNSEPNFYHESLGRTTSLSLIDIILNSRVPQDPG